MMRNQITAAAIYVLTAVVLLCYAGVSYGVAYAPPDTPRLILTSPPPTVRLVLTSPPPG